MPEETPEKPYVMKNIKLLLTYEDEQGRPAELRHDIPEGFVWYQAKRDIKNSHLETLKAGGETKVEATVEVKLTYTATMKGTVP